jgi:DNA-binding CsgD family transcriptional regulator
MGVERAPRLRGRTTEREKLDRLLKDARRGRSGVVVIRAEAGAGKTALLRYAGGQAAGFRVGQIAGVESEMELPFAGLHQLCAPMLAHLDALPDPQQAALRVAFGLSSGDAPDRFLVALAALSLLAEVAEERPLLCLVDDAQWLDTASRQVLGFVARRLLAEPVALMLAVREPTDERELVGLPEMSLTGLADDDARALLEVVVPGRLDERVRDRIVAETRGNPLALLELYGSVGPAQLAGGFALPDAGDVVDRIEEQYRRRIAALPDATRRLMLLAAGDPVGDATLVWRAAQELGLEREALEPASAEQLLEIGARVRFRHPLVRSAAYRAASADQRRDVHRALAEATDPELDPDRRAWHLAEAAVGPDEDVSAELEGSAGRAQARGGVAAAAAFLERAAALTSDPGRRAGRALAAAQANLQAGAFEAAFAWLAAVEAGPLEDLQRAQVELLRGQIALASSFGSEAPALLLKAARRLESLDIALARQTYLDALTAAFFAGRLEGAGGLHEVSQAARSAPKLTSDPRPSDLLLDGLSVVVTEGLAAAATMLKRATRGFAEEEIATEEGLRWGWAAVMAPAAAAAVWDEETWHTVVVRQLLSLREMGLLSLLPIYLNSFSVNAAWRGEFAPAASLVAEADAIAEATGTRFAHYADVLLAGFRGAEAEALALIEGAVKDASDAGQGVVTQWCELVTAILYNGLCRYEKALASARQASEQQPEWFISGWALAELVEAATRTGRTRVAVEALEGLAEVTKASATDWGLGVHARCRALLGQGGEAEGPYREAIDRLSRTRLRPDLARAHLLYGEWLRREGRRVDARERLHDAHDMFASMGAEGFAERARRELLATGEKVRKRRDDTRDELTPQEEQIARLARDGRTNPEIGAELFISPRTVEWHLRKVFTKLGISTRKGLRSALPDRDQEPAPA